MVDAMAALLSHCEKALLLQNAADSFAREDAKLTQPGLQPA